MVATGELLRFAAPAMYKAKSILVGVDFTPCSAVALAQAVRLAGHSKAKVHVLHVIDTVVVTEMEEALAPIQKEIRAGLVRDAEQAWPAFAAGVEGAAMLPLTVAVNNRVAAMLEFAKKYSADLVVLGAFGGEDPDLGVGTLASTCVRSASADVLLARDDHRGPYRRVVVGVDFSETSKKALERAAALAHGDGAELHVLHVFQAPWKAVHWRAPNPAATPGFEKQYREGLEGRLHAFADVIVNDAAPKSVRVVLHDHSGHRSGIVDYASKVRADLVVLGTRGRTNLRDVFLGSTAEKTLRDCSTSVLAVRAA